MQFHSPSVLQAVPAAIAEPEPVVVDPELAAADEVAAWLVATGAGACAATEVGAGAATETAGADVA